MIAQFLSTLKTIVHFKWVIYISIKKLLNKTPTYLHTVLRTWYMLFPLTGMPFPISLPLTNGRHPPGS